VAVVKFACLPAYLPFWLQALKRALIMAQEPDLPVDAAEVLHQVSEQYNLSGVFY
jgi:hypothetical protein